MGKGEHLGEFEQVVLLALAGLGDRIDGKSVYEEIVGTTGRDVSVAAVYVTLARLEKKGYVSVTSGGSGVAESGRIRKYFELETAGAEALTRSRDQLDALWESARAHPELREY